MLPKHLENAEVKTKEREGWRRVFEENDWTVSADDVLSLPEQSEDPHWQKVAKWMDWVEALLDPLEGKTGIDLACGLGWGAARFARGGARMIAADFNDTEHNGLGAAILVRARGLTFDGVCCDCEALPVAHSSVDFVFVCSALHHFTQPEKVLAGIHRVLKPGGLLIAICEAFRTGIFDRTRESRHEDLVEFREAGINENSYRQGEYERLFSRAGLEIHTHLSRWDWPVDGTPGKHWRNVNAASAIDGQRRAWLRGALRVAHRTPLLDLLRWVGLRWTVRDRALIGLKR